MNESASRQALIIGIGNPLRSDDGLGWVVAEHLSQESDLSCNVHLVHQLTPELAQWMVVADLIIMIDASHEGEPGELHIRLLSSYAQPGPIGAHHMRPEELAALTATVYGHCPPVVVVTMTGTDFSLGERLSAIVTQQIPRICAVVHQVYQRDPESGTFSYLPTITSLPVYKEIRFFEQGVANVDNRSTTEGLTTALLECSKLSDRGSDISPG